MYRRQLKRRQGGAAAPLALHAPPVRGLTLPRVAPKPAPGGFAAGGASAVDAAESDEQVAAAVQSGASTAVPPGASALPGAPMAEPPHASALPGAPMAEPPHASSTAGASQSNGIATIFPLFVCYFHREGSDRAYVLFDFALAAHVNVFLASQLEGVVGFAIQQTPCSRSSDAVLHSQVCCRSRVCLRALSVILLTLSGCQTRQPKTLRGHAGRTACFPFVVLPCGSPSVLNMLTRCPVQPTRAVIFAMLKIYREEDVWVGCVSGA